MKKFLFEMDNMDLTFDDHFKEQERLVQQAFLLKFKMENQRNKIKKTLFRNKLIQFKSKDRVADKIMFGSYKFEKIDHAKSLNTISLT
jgi:hypothetical protein